MVKKTPKWKEFEIVVANIQKRLAPKAEVHHDHWIIGKSGRKRKLDIAVFQKVGAYPIFIAFDCKKHKKIVKMKDVEAFAGQVEDVRANLGVMISNLGFDAGAKAIASQKNIILQTFRSAEETDWKRLIGENAWCFLTKVEAVEVKAYAVSGKNYFEVPFNVIIFSENGEIEDNLKDLFWRAWNAPESPHILGKIDLQLKADNKPFIIHKVDKFFEIPEFFVQATLIAKRYLVNMLLAQGSVLEDAKTGETVYEEVASQGVDWAEIIKSQEGIEITSEEYEEIWKTPQKLTANLNDAKRFVRIVIGN